MTHGPGPVAGDISTVIGGSVSGQLATGNDIVQTTVHGVLIQLDSAADLPTPQARTRPVDLRPRDFAELVGRKRELDAVRQGLSAHEPVAFHGLSGIGKTALLRHVAHRSSLSDGVVYLDRRGQALEDVVQQLWDAFWTSQIPSKVKETEARLALADVRALILVDDADGPGEELDAIVDLAPRCGVVFASASSCYRGPGTVRALSALAEADALAMLERELAGASDAAESSAALRLSRALGGRPGRIRQAALAAIEVGERLEALSARLDEAADSDETLDAVLLAGLEEEQRLILSVLDAFDGVPVPGELVVEITGRADAWARLEALVNRGLAESHSPRFTSAAPDARPGRHDVEERLAEHAAAWATRHADEPGVIASEANAIVVAARRARDPSGVLRLARAADRGLVLGARWGAWRSVLEASLAAAHELGDRAGEAWALHQLGSQALLAGQRAQAAEQLRRALELREELRDEIGAAVTRHNLAALGGSPPPPSTQDPTPPPPRPRWPLVVAAGIAAVAVSGAVAVAVSQRGEGGDDNGTSSSVSTTPTAARVRVGSIRGPTQRSVGQTGHYTVRVRRPAGKRASYHWSLRGVARLQSASTAHTADAIFTAPGSARLTVTVAAGARHITRHLAITVPRALPNEDRDGDGSTRAADCNDRDATIHPGARDIPDDGIDQDCSGTDAHQGTSLAVDEDKDKYDTDTDCNDHDAKINPGATDIPDDGVDQNCDGTDATTPITEPVDNDKDGYPADADCNDQDASIHPGAREIRGDGIDQDCNGSDLSDIR